MWILFRNMKGAQDFDNCAVEVSEAGIMLHIDKENRFQLTERVQREHAAVAAAAERFDAAYGEWPFDVECECCGYNWKESAHETLEEAREWAFKRGYLKDTFVVLPCA